MLSGGANGSGDCAFNGIGVAGIGNSGDELFGLFIAGGGNACTQAAGFFAAGVINFTEGECIGAQVGGLFNLAGNLTGVQSGLVNYIDRGDWCAQIGGLVSYARYKVDGVQLATFTRAGVLHGVQLGFWNITTSAAGMQIGVINYADRMTGMQIGAINVIKNSALPFFPVVNMRF